MSVFGAPVYAVSIDLADACRPQLPHPPRLCSPPRRQAIARHPVFENLTLGVIGFNALWIWTVGHDRAKMCRRKEALPLPMLKSI